MRPTRGRVAVLIALFVLALVAAKSCQQSQIRIDEREAIALAKQQVDFEPKETQIRLVRQGLSRQPFWFVSLSDPIGSAIDPEGFSRLVLVKIDANKGTVEEVSRQEEGTGAQKQPAGTGGKGVP